MKPIRMAKVSILTMLVTLGAVACSYGTTQAAPDGARSSEAATTTTSLSSARPTGERDELVPIGPSGARLHITCSGSGSTTVVLIAGLGDAGDGWGAIRPAVTSGAHVCSYARFGLGTSDAPPSDQTFTSEARDLHELLEVAGEPGPYVLVGHSFGGVEAVMFASEFRDEVEGMVLIDASPARWPEAVCAVPDDGSEAAAGFRETCMSISHGAGNPERLAGLQAFDEVSDVRTLGDLPMRVLTRAVLAYPGLASASADRLSEQWHDGQARWASLSSSGAVVPVEDTGHHIQLEQPAVVIEQIEAVRAGAEA